MRKLHHTDPKSLGLLNARATDEQCRSDAQQKRNAAAWGRRAIAAIKRGDYTLAGNLAAQANLELKRA